MRPIGRWATAGLLFLAVLSLAWVSARSARQLGALAGITDEYFMLGIKLRVNGTLGPAADEPSALRPPGYPGFIAGSLMLLGPDPARTSASTFWREAERVLSLAQAFLLAASAAVLYLWLSSRLGRLAALTAGVLLGLNAHSLALVGLWHYDLLHWLSLLLACWATERALRAPRPAVALAGAGLLWGLSNLVRPVTLLLPAFLLLAWWLWQRVPLRIALVWSLCLAAGMAAAIAPWTARNWRVTGRMVAVVDHPWTTLWGQTVKPLDPDPNRYVWFELYLRDLLPIFTRVTGAASYDYVLQNRLAGELDSAFREQALRNLREHPLVYVRNVALSLVSFGTGFGSVLVTTRSHLQWCLPPPMPGEPPAVRQSWFIPGSTQDFHPRQLGQVYAALGWLVTALAAAGVLAGARRGEPQLVLASTVLGAIGITQSLFFLSMMHYYVKWPFLLALAACWLDGLERSRLGLAAVARGLGALLCALSLATALWLLFVPAQAARASQWPRVDALGRRPV